MSDLVSVIVPNYNSSYYIKETILSVIHQSYENIEIIIIDDCSTDNSVEIIKNMSDIYSNIYLIELPKNCGRPAKPRNIGLEKAKGKYIAFLDSDDIWHEQKIEIQLYFMNKHNVSFSASLVKDFNKIIDEKDKFLFPNYQNSISVNFKTLNQLLIKNFIKSGSSVVCHKNLINNIKFNESPEYKAVEDYQFWIDIHKKDNFSSILIKEKLIFYRHSESSISKDKFMQAKRIFNLLSDYKKDERKLGYKKYIFFGTYIVLSLLALLDYRK